MAQANPSGVNRYHPALVALHWALAILLTMSLIGGMAILDGIPNDSPDKIGALFGHMIAGSLIAILITVRLIVRFRTSKPPEPDSGSAFLNRIARPVHLLAYALVFGMVGTGMAMSVMAGLPAIVFFGSGDPLPATFDDLPTRAAHTFIAFTLIGFIAVHLAAVTMHEMRGTELLRRMWFGDRAT
ncbi:MAG: cytochrome b/b6 domain-containing protein [Pseudomonadota bacterium]